MVVSARRHGRRRRKRVGVIEKGDLSVVGRRRQNRGERKPVVTYTGTAVPPFLRKVTPSRKRGAVLIRGKKQQEMGKGIYDNKVRQFTVIFLFLGKTEVFVEKSRLRGIVKMGRGKKEKTVFGT